VKSLANDERYYSMLTLGEKKNVSPISFASSSFSFGSFVLFISQLFEEFKRTFKKRAEEKKREKLRKAREEFISMLSESREISKESRFDHSWGFL
jgi:hypothetical protein